MRAIQKGPEPKCLLEERARGADYDDLKCKDKLREALHKEQHGLCCYCMNRIFSQFDKMKVEHWLCQSDKVSGSKQMLVYANLLGACFGGEGKPKREQHCDTRKGDQSLKWNPADPVHQIENKIYYEMSGRICSNDPEFDSQLEGVLNLNLPFLQNQRKAQLDAVLRWWKQMKAKYKKPPKVREIEAQIHKRIGRDGPFEPFSPVAVYWLKKKISR